MIIHFCDKCGEEAHSPTQYFGREFCGACAEMVEHLVQDWTDNDHYEEEYVQDNSKQYIEWNPQALGFPSEMGLYLVTVEFNNKNERTGDYYKSRMIRIAKYTGAPCWYKPGKEFGLIEETGGKVTAWAELPVEYKTE